MCNWLDEHLETFVRPALGFIPNVEPKDTYVQAFTPEMVELLVRVWRKARERSGGRKMLLAGRDVYLLYVISQLDDYPVLFRRDISAATAPHVVEDYRDCYLIDTGYKGTIPKALKLEYWDLISFSGAKTKEEREQHQLFDDKTSITPRPPPFSTSLTLGSPLWNLASNLEGHQKYWSRGEMINKRIIQWRSSPWEFFRAAMITMHVVRTIVRMDKCL